MRTEKDTFIEYLKTMGLKFTAERRHILEAVFSFHRHFELDDIYDAMKRREARTSRATIYRTLPLLKECGLIREVFRCQDRPSYEHIYGHDHHDHMLCIKCGRHIEFSDERIGRAQKEICSRFGFTPADHRLSIRGYCRKCAPRGNGKR